MKVVLKVVLSVGLLAALIIFLPWHDAAEAVRRLSLGIWLLVLAGFLAGHFVGTLKWRLIVNAARARLGVTDAVMCYSAGLFANLCLPSIVGGDVLRATMVGRITRRPEAAAWGGVADRLTDLIAVMLLVLGGLLFSREAIPGAWGEVLTALVAVGGIVIVGLVPFLLKRPIKRWPKKVRRPLARTLVSLRRTVQQPKTAFAALLLSLIVQGGFVLLNAALGDALGVQVSLGVWFLVWPIAKISALLPISLGGLAVREATLAALLLPFGVPAALGVLASLVWQSVLIAGGLIAGLLWLLLRRRRADPVHMRDAMRSTEAKAGYA